MVIRDDPLADQLAAESPKKTRDPREKLITLGSHTELFHTPEGIGYAAVMVHGHREVWGIRSSGFSGWLRHQYFSIYHSGPPARAVSEAVDTLEALARYGVTTVERRVYHRIAPDPDGNGLWLDLCDPLRRALHITANGWSVESVPSVYFSPSAGSLRLPEPQRGGAWDVLWRIGNLQTKEQRILTVSWLIGVFLVGSPKPLLAVEGEQGSAKSVLSRILQSLLDPHAAGSRRLPKDDRDLFVAASNCYILSYDNLSGLPPWLSDALCGLSTGVGFATRKLHTDTQETILNVSRAIIANGIDGIATRADLRDRTLLVTLDRIPDTERRTEVEIWEEFETERPKILGLLLDAVSAALRHWPTTLLERAPRMADFARWVAAAERGGALPWGMGEFLQVFSAAQESMAAQAVEADHLAQALLAMIAARNNEPWDGTATELAATLQPHTQIIDPRRDAWITNARSLSARLRRLTPDLRKEGLFIDFERKGKGRVIKIGSILS